MEELKYFTLTLDGGEGTITYLVQGIQTESDGSVLCLLSHPLCPTVLMPLRAATREDLESLQTQTQGKSNLQRWIEYTVKRANENLDVWVRQNSDSLALLFVVNRRLTKSQKGQLSSISGKIATYYFHNDLKLARRYVRENYVLLDDYNKVYFDRITEQLDRIGRDGKPISPSEGQRETLFNIAGFALSQGEP